MYPVMPWISFSRPYRIRFCAKSLYVPRYMPPYSPRMRTISERLTAERLLPSSPSQ